MTEVIERLEDMSIKGRLRLYLQEDGDIIIAVHEQTSDGLVGCGESVEFCTSGGKSPRTLAALRMLAEAMRQDNAERPLSRGDDD